MKKVKLGNGEICVSLKYNVKTKQGKAVTLHRLPKKERIGKYLYSGPTAFSPKVPPNAIIITCDNNKSLDILIKALERLRK